VLRNALIQLKDVINDREVAEKQDSSAATKKLLIIEFARDEYREAIEDIMRSVFASNAHILFTHADTGICLQRIHERALHPHCEDDHPSCSDRFFIRYYGTDNRKFIQTLHEQYSPDQCVGIVESDGTLDQFKQCVSSFWKKVLCNNAARLVAAPG
jgi:hypothetical protein